VEPLLPLLQKLLLHWYRKRLTKSLVTYLRTSFPSEWRSFYYGNRAHTVGGDFMKSVNAGRDVLDRATKASWFEWLGGSTLVFWKWHCFQFQARDGFPTWFLKPNLKITDRKFSKASPPKDDTLNKLWIEKLERLLYTKYLEVGFVKWDIHFFGVIKGDNDIRLVFNGTSNGLNEIVWAPSFFLPTSNSLAMKLQPDTYQLDLDVGEMFLNFPLHHKTRSFSGVNLTGFDKLGLEPQDIRQRWSRL